MLLLAPLLASLFLAGVSVPHDAAPETLRLTFGVYQTDKATEMYRKFTPVLEELQAALAETTTRDTDIHLRIFRSYDEGIQALANGEVDFVRFGPASYILAKELNPHIELLVMEEKNGKTRFNGVVFTRADSAIRSTSDLRDKSFAFGDRNSTIGRYLAQDHLVRAGIRGSDLARFAYLDRHDKVTAAVLIGDFDAGSAKESTFKKANKDGGLRALFTFENVSKPWIASQALPEALRATVREILLAMNDESALETLNVSGFRATQDSTYDLVREGIAGSRAFAPNDAE